MDLARDENQVAFLTEDNTPAEQAEIEAQKALQKRPSFSIRTRLSLGFFLFFLLSLGVTIAALIIISKIENKLKFMEAVSTYTFEIQQARRFEKNFFLYHTNLEDALDNVHKAQQILISNDNKIKLVVGKDNYNIMLSHVRRYEELLSRLGLLIKAKRSNQQQSFATIEAELRMHGAEMVAVAQKLVDNERLSVHQMLSIAKQVPLIFLVFLFFLIAYMVNFLARQMLGPLTRLMEATQRIASGDFTPIRPARRYRDEFTNLTMALNRMVHELKQREKILIQSHKLQAIGTLTAGVAHELNNPINNIMLTATMLLEDYKKLDDKERLEMINDLLNESERSKNIVANLLDFARESELKSEPLRIDKFINEAIQLVSNQLRLSKVKLALEVPSHLPAVHGDPHQLTQVLLNIILNALDAMPEGGNLKITAQLAKERDFIEIQVTDSGIGISEHFLPFIFDPFFSRKSSGKKSTGLGLSVSLGIIRKHGGDIKVKSKIGEGTTFTIILPTARIPADLPSGQ